MVPRLRHRPGLAPRHVAGGRRPRLGPPEPALLLKHFPEHAFKSNPKGWVVPFECVHKGVVRMSTTYAAEVIGRMPKPGERK